MLRGHISYPKKKKKETKRTVGVTEPVRKSMYDVALENFRRVNRVTYLHRVIYVGEHFFKRDQHDVLVNFFSDSITQTDKFVDLEKLTGFLLIYNKYIVHMVEGNEGAIYRHLKCYLDNEEHKKRFGASKLVIHISHIRRRLIDSWKYYNGTPSKLLTDIDINSDLENSGRIVFNCIKKIYNLVITYQDDVEAPEVEQPAALEAAESSVTVSSSVRSARAPRNELRISNVSLRTMQPRGLDRYRTKLPENEILNFIILTPFTQELRQYYDVYGIVPQRDLYKDRVWPVPSDFIPYDIFTKPYDCITMLPKDKEPKEEKEEDIGEIFEEDETGEDQ